MNVCVAQQLANIEATAITQMVGLNAPALQHGPVTAVKQVYLMCLLKGPA